MSKDESIRYELVVLMRPELEAKQDDVLKKISSIIDKNGGKIIKEDNWGRKELAYKIDKETHALYHIYRLDLPSSAPAKISAVLNITHEVIRHLIVKVDEKAEAIIEAEKKKRLEREANREEKSDK